VTFAFVGLIDIADLNQALGGEVKSRPSSDGGLIFDKSLPYLTESMVDHRLLLKPHILLIHTYLLRSCVHIRIHRSRGLSYFPSSISYV
jgi:hypothetical protein